MALILDTLKFGDLNNIKENDDNHTGDRRRTTALTALRFASEKAFEKDTLVGISEFCGVVVGKRQINFSTYDYQGTLFATALVPRPDPDESPAQETSNWLYRVYIPEISPWPAPKTYSDPNLMAYKEIPIDMSLMPTGDNPVVIEGDVVRVRYQDTNSLFGPKIIKKVSKGWTEWNIGPPTPGDWAADMRQAYIDRVDHAVDQENDYSPSNSPTSTQYARTAAGTIKSQAGIVWRPTGQRVYNGKLHRGAPTPGGDSVNAPSLIARVKTKSSSGRDMSLWALEVCIPDFLALQEAYNQTFAGSKYIGSDFLSLAGFYRNYARQLSLKVEKPNLAATPGTSNHGWGLSWDMNSSTMFCGGGYSPPSTWTNKPEEREKWAVDMKIAWKQAYPKGRKKISSTLPDKYITSAASYKKIKWEMDVALKAQSIKWRWLNRYGGDDYNFVLTVIKEAWHFDWKRRPDFFHMSSAGMTSASEKNLARKGTSRVNRTPSRVFGHGIDFLPIGPKATPWVGATPGVGPFGGDVRPHVRPAPIPQTGAGPVDFGDLEPGK